MEKRKIVICDLDGCFADDRWRKKFIDENKSAPKKYRKYLKKCIDDPLLNEDVLKTLLRDEKLQVIFITARESVCLHETAQWVHNNFLNDVFSDVSCYMRPKGNIETSPHLKPYLYEKAKGELGFQDEDVVALFDDRDDVLEAMGKYGFPCLKMSADKSNPVTNLLRQLIINGAWLNYDLKTLEKSRKCQDEMDVLRKSQMEDFHRLYLEKVSGFAVGEDVPGSVVAKDGTIEINFIPVERSDGQTESPMDFRFSSNVSNLLWDMAGTFEERNKVYADNYKRVGSIMEILHGPDSAAPATGLIGSAEQFNVWHLYELMIVKLTRFANSGLTHVDSIHDLAIYSAMIESLINPKEEKENG